MFTARHDPDRMSITEAFALTQGAALGVAMVLTGPALWLDESGAPVVIVYAFAMAMVLFATAHVSARAALALALTGAVAGLAVVVPYLLRTGASLTGLAGVVALGSALTVTARGVTAWARHRPAAHVPFIDQYPTQLETSVPA